MRTNWSECPGGDQRGHWAAMYVTMNPRGHIVFSKRVHERMNEAKAVVMLFDTVNSRIGLKPTHPTTKNAYGVCKSGNHGGRIVRALRVMQEYGIDLPETIQFNDVEFDQDGILILDLRTARVSNKAGYGRRKKGEKAVKQQPNHRAIHGF